MDAYHRDLPLDLQAFAFQEMLQDHPFQKGSFSREFFDKSAWFDSTAVW